MEVTLLERPNPEWTIARCNQVMHELKKDRELAAELASLSELAESWKNVLQKRADTGENRSDKSRLVGSNRD